MSAARRTEILVLGIGNLLWADEGFGVRCVEALDAQWEMPPGVDLRDGGTQGLALVDFIRDARRVLVFDCVDWSLAPGELRVARDAEVPSMVSAAKASLHQTSFLDVLTCAALLGGSPDRLTVIGCQAGELEDWGGSLTAAVRARLPEAVALGLGELAAWGFAPRARAVPKAPDLFDASLALAAYESGRPSEHEACRIGDRRFLPAGGE